MTQTNVHDFSTRLNHAKQQCDALRQAIASVIVGQNQIVDQVLLALLAGGHVLLEGAPGLGKTLLVRTLAASVDLKFSRIQFTPDLMPSDVTGTNVLVTDASGGSTGRFELHKGPIFGQIVLADEINRATPKTQSALLEAMQEHAVTISGTRHVLDEPFFVLATENPIEMEGTYPLPEAQLDRFLLKVLVPMPNQAEMTAIIARTTGHAVTPPTAILHQEHVLSLQRLCRDIAVAEPVITYAANLVFASNPTSPSAGETVRRALRYGAGVRAGQSLILAAKALALLEGRAQVAFGDVARVALPVLRHRLILSFEGEADGFSTDQVIDELVKTVPSRPHTVEQAVHAN